MSVQEPLTGQRSPRAAAPAVGSGPFTYLPQLDWARLPDGWQLGEAVSVATNSRDQVYVFARAEHPVMVFGLEGDLQFAWGEGVFTGPHGIHIGPDDSVYCTDYLDHTVRKFTPEGKLLFTLGTAGVLSDTGATTVDYRTIRRAGLPFAFPTNLVLTPADEMYIADGYGNARVHKFDAAGKLLFSWGEPGSGPGQFAVPHGIALDRDGLVYIADRENSRIQRFDPYGRFVDQWTDLARPSEVFIDAEGYVFVAELGYRAGMFEGNRPPTPDAPGGRVSVLSPTGEVVARWGGGDDPYAAGDFFAPHDIWVDRRGNLYVSEVCYTAGVNKGLVGPEVHTLQKFVRLADASL